MSLKRGPKLGFMAVAFAMAFALAPTKSKVVYADDGDVTLTGCVIQGTDGDKGYLLTQVLPASIDMSARAAARGASSVIYWLDDLENDDDVPNYAGKRVEVRGKLEGDIKKGEMEVERDGDWVRIEITSDGRNVKTRIPWVSVMPNRTDAAVGTSGTTLKEGKEIEMNINVRTLDVKDVKIVSGSCQ